MTKMLNESMIVNQHLITYTISDNKARKVVIIQHGAFMNNGTMTNLVNEFANGDYKVICADLPNHRNIDGEQITSVDIMADTMASFINQLKCVGKIGIFDDITYVGWSMGGSIGLELAYRQSISFFITSKLVNRIVLVDSSYVWDTIPSIPEDQFPNAFPAMYQSTLSSKLTPEEVNSYMEQFPSQLAPVKTSMADIVALQAFNMLDKLEDIKIPVLIVSGTDDPLATVQHQYTMSAEIPYAKLVMFTQESHCLPIDNAPEVANAIKKFIKYTILL